MQRAVAEPMCTTQNTQPTWANREEQVFASFNPFTPNISLVNSPCCLSCITYDVSLENLALNHLVIF